MGADRGTPPESSLHEMPGYQLVKLGELALMRADQALAPLGLSAREYNVLRTASERDERSQQELSAVVGINPTIMVAIVDRLEDAGLIERRRDPADRRRHALAATSRGRAAIQRGGALLAEAQDELLGGLDPRERDLLADLARRALAPLWPHTAPGRSPSDS